jgi:hypothetical protein
MMLTEQEASTRACPLMLATEPFSTVRSVFNCIGPRCMAWRWVDTLSVDNPSRVPGAARQEAKRERGFCGLAVRP